jgi:hypothetical protein
MVRDRRAGTRKSLGVERRLNSGLGPARWSVKYWDSGTFSYPSRRSENPPKNPWMKWRAYSPQYSYTTVYSTSSCETVFSSIRTPWKRAVARCGGISRRICNSNARGEQNSLIWLCPPPFKTSLFDGRNINKIRDTNR